jgi:hypothetical protein
LLFCSIIFWNVTFVYVVLFHKNSICDMDCDMVCDRSQVVYRNDVGYTDKLLALRARRVASSGVALRAPPSLASPLVPTARLALTRSRNRTLRVLFIFCFMFWIVTCAFGAFYATEAPSALLFHKNGHKVYDRNDVVYTDKRLWSPPPPSGASTIWRRLVLCARH